MQIDRLALGVGHLDAEHGAARHHSNADGMHGQAAGDVIGQADHAGGAGAGGGFKLIQRHHRAGAVIHNLALHAVIVEHSFEQAAVLLHLLWGELVRLVARRGLGEQVKRRQFPRALGRLGGGWRRGGLRLCGREARQPTA